MAVSLNNQASNIILREGETEAGRKLQVRTLKNEMNESLQNSMNWTKIKPTLSFKLRKMVWFVTRGKPNTWRTKSQIDAKLSIEAGLQRGITVDQSIIARAHKKDLYTLFPAKPVVPTSELPVSTVSKQKNEIEILQNLNRAADASPKVKELLKSSGYDIDRIDAFASDAISQPLLPPSTVEASTLQFGDAVQKENGLREVLINLASEPVVKEQLEKQGFDLGKCAPVSSGAAILQNTEELQTPKAPASSPAAFAVDKVKLDPSMLLQILGLYTSLLQPAASNQFSHLSLKG